MAPALKPRLIASAIAFILSLFIFFPSFDELRNDAAANNAAPDFFVARGVLRAGSVHCLQRKRDATCRLGMLTVDGAASSVCPLPHTSDRQGTHLCAAVQTVAGASAQDALGGPVVAVKRGCTPGDARQTEVREVPGKPPMHTIHDPRCQPQS
jgi:hypothetical protein